MRIGFHVGTLSAADVQLNRASQRMIYSGPIAHLAKAVNDAGHGGQITLSAAALARLDFVLLHREAAVVLHVGRHLLKYGEAEVELYGMYRTALVARAAYVHPPRTMLQKVRKPRIAPGVRCSKGKRHEGIVA